MRSVESHAMHRISIRITRIRVARLLLAIGYSCLLTVVLTHIAERLNVFPSMGWGLRDSPGHYVDLFSAIAGVVLLSVGYVAHHPIRAKQREISHDL